MLMPSNIRIFSLNRVFLAVIPVHFQYKFACQFVHTMPTSRIAQFDYIRIISLLGILLCHSMFESYSYSWLGRYFAMTFNFLFLALSAFLLGMAWDTKGNPKYEFGFFVSVSVNYQGAIFSFSQFCSYISILQMVSFQ